MSDAEDIMLHAYRLLLFVLPSWFREEFADEMRVVFQDTLADLRRDGVMAVARLWMHTVVEVLGLGLRLHVDAMRQDAASALRSLRRAPTFTLAIIATLAIGLGPTLVIANLLQQVVINPLPFADPDRLVGVWTTQPESNRREFPLSLADYMDYRSGQHAFDALAAHAGTSVAFVGAHEPRQLAGVLTSAELFDVLRIAPILGRPLTPHDTAPGAPAVMVIGDDFWRAEFAGRADVIGQIVRVDGVPTEIVGVLPRIGFPTGSSNFWLPLTIDPNAVSRGSRYLNATGRVASTVSIKQAAEVLNGIASRLAREYPSTNAGHGIELVDLKRQLNGESPRLIAVLAVAIAAVLLIACTNVASLLAVRSSLRYTELGLRAALGASLRRLHRQLLIEHIALVGFSALVAVAIAIPLHRFIVDERVIALPPLTTSTIAWPAFAMLIGLVVVIAAALARATARRRTLVTSAAALLGGMRVTGTRTQRRWRQVLVMAEVAGALALVLVAGLMLRSAARLAQVEPGFRTDNVITFGVVLPGASYPQPADRTQFVERVVEELRRLPSVTRAAPAAYAPMGAMRATRRFAPADRPPPAPGSEPLALDMPVGAGYFEVMGVSLLDGRTFDQRDTASSPPVLVVSETFAREQFPNERAVGKMVRFFTSRPGAEPPPSRQIVGVVRDVRQDSMRTRPIAQMYSPYPQTPWGFVSFFVEVAGTPPTVAPLLQRAVSAVDPSRPVRDVKMTADIVGDSLARQRAMTWLLSALASIALLLAAIGLYGVSATAASARARELAIRAAVGAQPGSLLRLMLQQGLTTALAGVAVGGLAGWLTTHGLGALLYETGPRDPLTFTVTATVLLAIAVGATYLPARRALRANPAEVLRAET